MFIYFLISFALLLQTPVRPGTGGTITGIVKATDGKPAAGVRVTARAKPDSLEDLQDGIAMSSIALTDQNGRYRLESVPPGLYYIAAGNLDLPTFYPGTLDVARGTIVQITAGAERTGIDFTLADLSFSLAGTSGLRPGYMIRLQIQVEGGGKVPVFSPNGLALLEARPPGSVSGTAVALGSGTLSLPFPLTPMEYEVRVLNVPTGYRVKSLTYGKTNLLMNLLHISAANVPLSNGPALTGNALSAVQVPQLQIPVLGGTFIVTAGPSMAAPDMISITFSAAPVPAAPGVNITGQTVPGARAIWLGGSPGFLYADGSFELRGVQPGPRVILASSENGPAMRPSGASLVVGERDIDGIQLDPLPLLPREVPPMPPSRHAPGTKIPLATLKGRLLSAATQQPLRGTVSIVGSTTQVAYSVDSDGRFEIPKLLPGSYNLTASIFDYYTVNETVVIGEEDDIVELRARPAY